MRIKIKPISFCVLLSLLFLVGSASAQGDIIINDFHAVMRVTDEGGYSAFLEFEAKNIGGLPVQNISLMVPYDEDKIEFWYATQEFQITDTGYQCARCGSFFSDDTYKAALQNAGVASYSAIDVEAKSYGGLVKAVIIYPHNETKIELVCAKDYEELTFLYGGWDNVSIYEQQQIIVRTHPTSRAKTIEKHVEGSIYSKEDITYLKIELAQPLGAGESSRISLRYKVHEKVTENRVIREDFSLALPSSSGIINSVISVIPPPHDIFRLTKPSLGLVGELPGYQKDVFAKVYAPATMEWSSIEQLSQKQVGLEAEVMKEGFRSSRTYLIPITAPTRVYRVIIPEIAPNEKIVFQGYYASNLRFYGAPIFFLAAIILIIALIKRGAIKSSLHTFWEYLK
jgi:hypothetical protein